MGGRAGGRNPRRPEEQMRRRSRSVRPRSRRLPAPRQARTVEAREGAWKTQARRSARTPGVVQERRQCAMSVRAGRPRRSHEIPRAISIPEVPVMALGLGSNMIVRDGGVPGVVVRLRQAVRQDQPAWPDDGRMRRRGLGDSGVFDNARLGHCRASNSCAGSRHGRRLRSDERRRLWARGQRYPAVVHFGAALWRGRRMAGRAVRPTATAIPSFPSRRWSPPRSSRAFRAIRQ